MAPDTRWSEATLSTPVLAVAATTGATRALKVLLASGARIDLADSGGGTALAWAAQKGHLSCVQHLLDAGANANTQDCLENTPLMEAVGFRHMECARALLLASDLKLIKRQGLNALFTFP